MQAEQDIEVINPRTGKVDLHIRPASRQQIDRICENLRTAQSGWAGRDLAGRITALNRFLDNLKAVRPDLIAALSQDTGRYGLSVMEVDGVAASIRRWKSIAQAYAHLVHGRSQALPFIQYQIEARPLPLVGVISPWNFPLTLALIDAIPALLAGCAVLIKPSEITPRFAAPLRKAIAATDGLSEVLAVIDGDGASGAALIDMVDAVCFTGSVATGRKVGEQAARNFIPSFLELGGKDPAIVLKGADIDRAVSAILRGSIINSGQGCQSIERIYVHHGHYDEFLDKLSRRAAQITLNTDDIHKGHLGPMIDRRQAHIIQAQIDAARKRGAVVHTGGEIVEKGGLWYPATVLSNVTHDMKLMREETFGPVMPVMAFDTEEEAIGLANDSDYGLSAAVFGPDPETAKAVGRRIEAGAISINDAALTALMYEAEKNSFKLSGLGASRMGPAGYERFFRKQSLMTNTANVFDIDQFKEENSLREES
ncbi:MAG TPA: aldehyde dehydrogenase family protein [Hellea balneolensis]|uniref:Aldehyde dehydrogenase family protein n=1 Tax=Hellea balneolensis TaxID=287478 RepID=A0A7V5NX40_9PROT|nr:aldehyde dehydrogenase family protein [Hellea balneolensis]